MANVVVCSPSRTLRFLHPFVFASIAICGFAAGASAQTTVTLSTPGTHINADMTIQGGAYGWTDFSYSDVLASKVSSESYTRRIMLKFDTQNYIPANAVIQSAQLYLVLKNAESTEGRPLSVYYVTKSFVTRETTWYTYRSGQNWSTAGGDLGARFGTTYVGNAVGSTYRFDVTGLVQRAVNGDYGSRYTRVALVDTGGGTAGNYREFHSTRSSNTGARPRLIVTYTTSGTTTVSPAPSTTTSSSSTWIRVMQWNVHKTKGSDGRCDPDRVANVIVAQKPDVVSLNEVNFYSGYCAWNFDMGEKLHSLVQAKTGVRWYRQHVNAGGVGNVILSRYAPVSSGSKLLSYSRGVAQMTIVVNGRNVNVFSTHVDYANSSYRTIQTTEAVRWMSNFSEPRIMMGDFNTWPNTSDYYIMANPYQDAWAKAKSLGTATSYNGTGATMGDSRFDYVYSSRVSALTLKSVYVPNPVWNGVRASDHNPVVAIFTVN